MPRNQANASAKVEPAHSTFLDHPQAHSQQRTANRGKLPAASKRLNKWKSLLSPTCYREYNGFNRSVFAECEMSYRKLLIFLAVFALMPLPALAQDKDQPSQTASVQPQASQPQTAPSQTSPPQTSKDQTAPSPSAQASTPPPAASSPSATATTGPTTATTGTVTVATPPQQNPPASTGSTPATQRTLLRPRPTRLPADRLRSRSPTQAK